MERVNYPAQHDDASPQNPSAVPARRTYVRATILNDHLHETSRQLPHGERQRLIDGLTYASAIPVPAPDIGASESSDLQAEALEALPGGLSDIDVRRFGAPSLHLAPQCQKQLAHQLKNSLLSITAYYEDAETGAESIEAASSLADRIWSQRDSIERERKLSETCRDRISMLVDEINQIHPRLEDDLVGALSTLPSISNAARTAEADLLSTTIEASLMKLSLMRTRMHIALYGHSSPNRPDSNMNRALATAMEKLRAKARAQEEEERELDGQISAYDGMLSLVGGKDGNFAQAVEDMARVKRETEECRKDLRRLGWTGD
ncbi:uncharacterized protein B0H18DRAFT_909078 [Fomitopsis serialis]|uniref:uncharacterized protein n=1 Tax=Fomitopsis serialis TaxID=139415 RepID=UPI002008AD59|nr:uncharacterized protein B0H18DRAFT_924449 [Neoantrodia serialis]XP_047892673.1 uncharacterized protein B0H18DRAFT_909078 [Neoantrodia serialis]KAH9905517.1 hypothetical protein B0H18DRAFT_924449 [Neoantrodia serialis]KAH9924744.1 hypothetical protein B0H18DRAFT_909078 [Neoantrodia serialis]